MHHRVFLLAVTVILAICIGPCFRAFARDAETMSMDQLIDTVQAKDIRDIPHVIAQLPEDMKREHFVLMYLSRSLQAATYDEPRAILFTPSARFVMAFNGGDPDKRGSNTIEMIQFRDQTRTFEFREIEFAAGGPAKISETNPEKCTFCHQSQSRVGIDMRPNWEPYNLWPGAYGSSDGHLQPLLSPSERLKPGDEQMIADQLGEESGYANYRKNASLKNPRYSQLGPLPPLIQLRFTDLLAELNFQRVARLIAAEKEITPSYFASLEYGLHCGGPEGLNANPYMGWNFAQKIPYYPSYKTNYDSLNVLISPIYEALGVDTSDWSMDFGTRGRFAFIDRFGTPSVSSVQLETALFDVIGDPEGYHELDCPELLQESQKRLKGFFDSGENLRCRRADLKSCPTKGLFRGE